ncbi:MAG: ribosome small subunit-dependent GTPase A [Sphingobacteriia bacterium]|nr:ribosome small subunit-dependent GTPase A [Sphingobacteriia bacterium]
MDSNSCISVSIYFQFSVVKPSNLTSNHACKLSRNDLLIFIYLRDYGKTISLIFLNSYLPINQIRLKLFLLTNGHYFLKLSGELFSMKKLGFYGKITGLIHPSDYKGYELARVISEQKERYTVQSASGVFTTEITGNLRFTAKSRLDFPVVGDWVKTAIMDETHSIIYSLFQRTSILKRRATDKFGETQVIAANIDCAFITQSVGRDFNLNRMERYLAICYDASIKPVIILTKTDMEEPARVEELIGSVKKRIKNITVIPFSAKTPGESENVVKQLEPYHTYCFIGSSGVGKSTLINLLAGDNILRTNEISSSTSKGKHTTSHRQLIILPNESLVIDTPGMREIGMADTFKGIELTYDQIAELARNCKFSDCRHINESGCAVLKALHEGLLSQNTYDNYQKLTREELHFSASVKEKRKKSREQGKIFKAIKAEKKKLKF